MVAVWCCLASKISDLPVLKRFLVRYRRAIIPAVYISLGIYILVKAFV
ncbi:MAG: cadmium resistance transporter [Sphaerochaetaceae bacterium]